MPCHRQNKINALICCAILLLAGFSTMPVRGEPASAPPPLAEIVASNRDAITDYALSLPGGPTYEALVPLMPPVRWVYSNFRHYPVLLSAPGALVKGRIASNGSALNPFANNPPTWKENGRELQLTIGMENEIFGSDPHKLADGRWLDGYKPVWVVDYISRNGSKWQLQVFAAVEPDLAALGALCFEIRLVAGPGDEIQLKLAEKNNAEQLYENELRKPTEKNKKKLARPAGLSANVGHWLKFSELFVADRKDPLAFQARFKPGESACGILLSKPTSVVYQVQFAERRVNCISAWEKLLAAGPKWHFPEAIIENAWRAHLIAISMIIAGSRPNYSAMNAYDHLYMTEGSDTLRGLAEWGRKAELKQVADAQFAFLRADTRTAVAGLKLTLARDLAEISGDWSIFKDQELRWGQARDFILNNLDQEHGLPPPDRYAGDLGGAVLNLRSSALCWRGLSDLAFALQASGRTAEAVLLGEKAETLRKKIIRALEESEKLYQDPDFVPIGFFGKDKPVARLPDTQLSSYYNLVMGNVLDSGILNREREDKVVRYLESRAGLSMGLPRTRPFWPNSPYFGQDGVAPLYGLRYSLMRLDRDQPDHALVAVYGWLAHGMTRQGFVHGEGVRFTGGDAQGRYFHLPPNATSAANWLTLLRHLVIHEQDADNDATYDTLRLLDATPASWMEDQKLIEFSDAPTRFGNAGLKVESRLKSGQILVSFDMPAKRPEAGTTVRLRLPKPFKASELRVGERIIAADAQGRFSVGRLPLKFQGVVHVIAE